MNKSMKFAALTLSTVATLLLALTLLGVANQIGSKSRLLPPVQNALAPLSTQQIADQANVELALKSLDKIPSTRFFALPVANEKNNKTVGLAGDRNIIDGNIFALSPKRDETTSLSKRRKIIATANPRPLLLPQVTVVLESGVNGKAVINGRLSRVGDSIEGGMVVSSINIASVMFSSGNEMFEVRMPLDRLRVLGAFPGSSRGN